MKFQARRSVNNEGFVAHTQAYQVLWNRCERRVGKRNGACQRKNICRRRGEQSVNRGMGEGEGSTARGFGTVPSSQNHMHSIPTHLSSEMALRPRKPPSAYCCTLRRCHDAALCVFYVDDFVGQNAGAATACLLMIIRPCVSFGQLAPSSLIVVGCLSCER